MRRDILAPPPPLPPLPATPDEAVRIALANNPDLVAISRQAIAAGYDVNVAQAGRLPTIAGVLSSTYVNNIGGTRISGVPTTGNQTQIGAQVNVPIFQGGLPAARIRQAQAEQGQVLEQVVGTERAVVQAARAAFATYDAAKKAIQSETVAVQANELALEGARAEQSVGTRTVLDVLNAEQELLNSQVALVTAKRDAYVAGFQLLNAMGQAQANASASTAARFTIRSATTVGSQETGTTGRAIRATRPLRHARSARRKCRTTPVVTPQIDSGRGSIRPRRSSRLRQG